MALEAGETKKPIKIYKKLEKMQVLKNAEICQIKKMKAIPWQIKFFQ